MAYDLIIIGILAFATWRGSSKGFVWQLATIAGIILCFVFAETVSVVVAPMIGLQPPLSRWVSIFGLYVIGSFAAFAVARGIRGWLEKMKFEGYDAHLGGVFGFIKGVVFSIVLTFFAVTLSESTRQAAFQSQSGYACALLFERIQPVLPQELTAVLDPYLHNLDPETIAKHRREQPGDDGANRNQDGKDDGSNNGAGQTISKEVQGILETLPAIFGNELRSMVINSLENTAPEDRPELVEKLKTGIPGLMRQVATEWVNGKPKEEVKQEANAEQRQQFLKEIASVYSDYPEAQELIAEEIAVSLDGVPGEVELGVLEDWHADLLHREPDPDAGTGITTSLDFRIVRQLSKNRVALNLLDQDLQNRLRESILQ